MSSDEYEMLNSGSQGSQQCQQQQSELYSSETSAVSPRSSENYLQIKLREKLQGQILTQKRSYAGPPGPLPTLKSKPEQRRRERSRSNSLRNQSRGRDFSDQSDYAGKRKHRLNDLRKQSYSYERYRVNICQRRLRESSFSSSWSFKEHSQTSLPSSPQMLSEIQIRKL